MSWIRRETEKGTVQYICPRCHDYHEFREDFGERTFSENYIFCRRCGARNGTGNAPTLTQPKDSTPVQHGRWVKPVPGDGENYCSVCHAVQPWFYGYGYYDSDYCPNCGACMDAKEELKDGVD